MSIEKTVYTVGLVVCLIGSWVTGPKRSRAALHMTLPQIYREARKGGLKSSVASRAFTAATFIFLILCMRTD